MKVHFDITRKLVLTAGAVFVSLFLIFWGSVEYYTTGPAFCGGTCHTMTEQYEAWKTNSHHANNNKDGVQANCVDCHFLPGEKYSVKAKLEGLRHLAAYLYDQNAPLPIRPKIQDGACLRSGCHDDGAFRDKEIQFTNKVRFKHTVHLGEKALNGQKLSCDDCHFKVTEKKHFEVPQDICFLCHLKLNKPTLAKAQEEGTPGGKKEPVVQRISFKQVPSIAFNAGASRCDICHVIPTRSLQAQIQNDGEGKDKPITHQSLQARGVPCESCHFEMVKGHGAIAPGNVVSNGCLTCHNRSPELLIEARDAALMHNRHVATRAADCFDCHSVIEHRNRTDHLDFVRNDCELCHQDQHKYQKILLTGVSVVDGVPETPQLMAGVNTNCMACHIKKSLLNNHPVRRGAGEACVGCHTDEHKKMLEYWQLSLEKEVLSVKEARTEARALLVKAEGVVPTDLAEEAKGLMRKGDEILAIVEVGNGVHNKKYSILLLDEAIGNFEDSIDVLQEGVDNSTSQEETAQPDTRTE